MTNNTNHQPTTTSTSIHADSLPGHHIILQPEQEQTK